ncbi:MAG: DegV family protein [Bowdeniella nasicola]|nr:DegV family protein [Bowdeniella nasicola]
MSFACITDSTCALTAQYDHITQVALSVSDDGNPTTSQPPVSAIVQAYEDAAAAGARSIVAPVLSGNISGTVAAFTTAAASSPIPVDVIDTRTAGGALGLVALVAAEAENAARAGALAREMSAKSFTGIVVGDVKTLVRGGRLNASKATMAAALGITPLIEVRNGRLQLRETARGKKRARARLIARAKSHVVGSAKIPNRTGQVIDLMVHCAPDDPFADQVAQAFADIPIRRHIVAPLPAVLTAHTGEAYWAIALAPALS